MSKHWLGVKCAIYKKAKGYFISYLVIYEVFFSKITWHGDTLYQYYIIYTHTHTHTYIRKYWIHHFYQVSYKNYPYNRYTDIPGGRPQEKEKENEIPIDWT